MNGALQPVIEALDVLARPLDLFVRDDDAGWDDARLFALLDVAERCEVPIDLAAIPAAVGERLARELNARIDAAPARLSVHQHGLAHANHEPAGRACEFGASRSSDAQRNDLLRGRVTLRSHFGRRLTPFFTPPWNRCAPATSALLAALGWRGLSRTRGAPPQTHLPELAVDLDWTREIRASGADALARRFAQAIAERGRDGRPLGLMLHHAVTSDEELALLQSWWRKLVGHPKARWRSMSALMPASVTVGDPKNLEQATAR